MGPHSILGSALAAGALFSFAPIPPGAEFGDEKSVVPFEATTSDCLPDAAAPEFSVRQDGRSRPARIPPLALSQDLRGLRIGRAFSPTLDHSAAIKAGHVSAVEQEFCRQDNDLICLSAAERSRVVGDLLLRLTRIESKLVGSTPERRGAQRAIADLRSSILPVVLFTTKLHWGPSAAVIRYRDHATHKWVLGIALARDFSTAGDDTLLLDGILVQEMAHYDDLAHLPAPTRCYESNIEIRGHYAMIAFWSKNHPKQGSLSPRIGVALGERLGPSSSRAAWYHYLNRAEKTDFRVEDELVSLEATTLSQLAPGPDEDRRFLSELSNVVNHALDRATDTRNNVASLAPDSINANARVMSAVSRLLPRILSNYQRVRGDLAENDGTKRRTATAVRVGDISRSLAVLESLKAMLASDPDFRRKSQFVGPE